MEQTQKIYYIKIFTCLNHTNNIFTVEGDDNLCARFEEVRQHHHIV